MNAEPFKHYPLDSDEVPNGWDLCPVGDAASVIESGFASGRHNREGRGTPHLRPMNVSRTGEIDLSEVRFIEQEPKKVLEKRDVLFNNTNSPALVGKTAVVEEEDGFAFSNHMTRVRCNEAAEPGFVAHQLHFLWSTGYFEGQCKKHVNQASVSASKLSSEIPLLLPPLNEQRRIVAKIEQLTARSRRAREALEAVPPLLDKLRQSVLAAAFSGCLTADWRKKNPNAEPASELLKRIRTERRRRWEEAEFAKIRANGKEPKNDRWKQNYKEPTLVNASSLSELPDGWVWATAEQLAPAERPVIYGIIKPGPDTRGGVPYVRVTEMKTGTIDVSSLKRCNPERAKKFRRATLASGDLLISKDGTIGKVALVPPELEGGNITQHVLRFSAAPRVLNRYLARMIEAPGCQSWMTGETKGIALQGVNVGDFRRMPIPLAPEDEQFEVANRVDGALSQIAVIEWAMMSQEESLSDLDRSILAKAFRGELVPQDPNDEPASALLERIRAQRAAEDATKKTARKKTSSRRRGSKTNRKDTKNARKKPGTPTPTIGPDPIPIVLEWLCSNPGPHTPAEILTATNLDRDLWPLIRPALTNHPDITITGRKRGTRYRWERSTIGIE